MRATNTIVQGRRLLSRRVLGPLPRRVGDSRASRSKTWSGPDATRVWLSTLVRSMAAVGTPEEGPGRPAMVGGPWVRPIGPAMGRARGLGSVAASDSSRAANALASGRVARSGDAPSPRIGCNGPKAP